VIGVTQPRRAGTEGGRRGAGGRGPCALQLARLAAILRDGTVVGTLLLQVEAEACATTRLALR
jgi:hypothetical protein